MTESPGQLLHIFLTAAAREPLVAVAEARAVAGQGLEGDRYFYGAGTWSKPGMPDREVTLVEWEALEALAREYGVRLAPAEARRNLVTRGVALNHLVGREFMAGEVRLGGIRLCEPCSHLEALCGKPVSAGLVHRGGLRAQILTGGTVRVGDPIRVLAP